MTSPEKAKREREKEAERGSKGEIQRDREKERKRKRGRANVPVRNKLAHSQVCSVAAVVLQNTPISYFISHGKSHPSTMNNVCILLNRPMNDIRQRGHVSTGT